MRADYYQLLDVSPAASQKDIKAAYHRLALRFHPDRNADNPAAEERFKLVAEAYRTLGVPERRQEYDNWLHLHNRYHAAPELAAMAGGAEAGRGAPRVRPVHFSARRAEERLRERREARRAERGGRYRAFRRAGNGAGSSAWQPGERWRDGWDARPRSRRSRGILARYSSKLNTWLFIGFYALIIINVLPIFFRHMVSPTKPTAKRATAPAVEMVSVDEARRRVLQMEADLLRRAEAGEAQAQYHMGLYLFNKSARGRGAGENPGVLRRAASNAYRQQAEEWFSRAASQGHEGARSFIESLRAAAETSPAAGR